MLFNFLLVLQIIIFIAGYWLSQLDARKKLEKPIPLSIRLLLSFSLVSAALLILLRSPHPLQYYSLPVFIGMCFSLIGDVILADVFPLIKRFVYGMFFFAAAHTCYIIAFILTITKQIYFMPYQLYCGLAIYLIYMFINWGILLKTETVDFLKSLVMLVYGCFLGTMAAFAFTLGCSLTGVWWITALSGLLFVVSDSLIAIKIIGNKKIKNCEQLIWLTYMLAQTGIIYSGWFCQIR